MKRIRGYDRRLRLLPGGKYADGADRPDKPARLNTLSKSFCPLGDDSKYHLNESKHVARWAIVNGKLLRLMPSRKGSRKGWTLKLATAAMFNAPIWTEYMDTVRADDKDLNKLIERSWNAV